MKTTLFLLVANVFFAAWNVQDGTALLAAMHGFAAGMLIPVLMLEDGRLS